MDSDESGGVSNRRSDQTHVLLVVSDTEPADSARAALERHDFDVSLERDASAVPDRLRNDPIDCLVVPDQLPSTTGMAIAEAIRANGSNVPIILLAPDSGEGVDDIHGSGISDYVRGDVTSVSFGQLANRIRIVVARHRSERAQLSERHAVDSLEQQIRATKGKITSLHGVAMSLGAARSPAQVYEETISAAEEILDLDICFLFAVEDDWFVPKAQSSNPTEYELRPVALDVGAMGESFRRGESMRAVDMELHPVGEPTFGAYRSGISVPIDEFGVFQAVSSQPGAFDDIDVQLAELLIAHTSSALRRLQFERQLRMERDQYAVLFDNASDCIVETEYIDGEPIVRHVNPAFERIFGYTADELLGTSLDDVVVPEGSEVEAEKFNRRGHAGERISEEVTRETADGPRDFLLRSVHLDDGVAYAVYTDISERKNRERALRTTSQKLETLNQIVSHDIRNELLLIDGWATLLADHVSAEGEQYLDDIATRIHHAVDLTETTHEYVDVSAGNRDVKRVAVDIQAVLSEQVANARSTFDDAVIEIDGDIPPVEIVADDLLGSVFRNLIYNAVKHNDKARKSVTISVSEQPESVVVHVADNGRGISGELQAELFEKGTRGFDSTGMGVGLSLVSTLVETYGGDVSVEGNDPEGSIFHVELPKADVTPS